MSFFSDVREKVRNLLGRGPEDIVMDDRQSENRTVRQRYRRMAERLTENSSLRDELDDEKAKELLDWGSGYLKKVADSTADLPDETADTIMEKEAERISGVLRQVNQLTRAIHVKDEQQLADHYKSLTQKLDELRETAEEVPETVKELLSLTEEKKALLDKQLVSPIDGDEKQINGEEE